MLPTERYRRAVTAGFYADPAKKTLMSLIDDRDKRPGLSQIRKFEHRGVEIGPLVPVAAMKAKAADFPVIRPRRVWPYEGQLRKDLLSQIGLVASDRTKPADDSITADQRAVSRRGRVELISFKIP